MTINKGIKMKTVKNILYSMDHTIERVKLRYNISINVEDYIEMCERVNNKKGVTFISTEKQKNDTQKIYDMIFKNVTIRVVWSETNKYIKTVLPIW